MGQSRPLFVYFQSFQTNNTIFTTIQCEKMSKYPSSMQRWDSNPQPSEHESPPIITRPGLPPASEHNLDHRKDLQKKKKCLFGQSSGYPHLCEAEGWTVNLLQQKIGYLLLARTRNVFSLKKSSAKVHHSWVKLDRPACLPDGQKIIG